MAGRRALSSFLACLLAAASASGQSEAYGAGSYYDQPDTVKGDGGSCSNLASPPTLVATARAFTMGSFFEASAPTITWAGRGVAPCKNDATPSSSVAYRATVPGGRSIAAIRFDLIPVPLASQAGFSPSFILSTATPWANVTGFFTGDTSADCGGGSALCTWSDNYDGETHADFGSPYRLRDLIAAGGGDYTTKVYYLSRSTTKQAYGPVAGMADLSNASYRAWRVADAKALVATGAYDLVMLNHKFCQWRWTQQNWLNGTVVANCGEHPGAVSTVTELHAANTQMFTAQPSGYGWTEYVQGWAALGDELKAAGVPFAVYLDAGYWLNPSNYDDPATVGVNEATLITQTAEQDATLVILDYGDNKRGYARSVEKLLLAAGREVLVVDQNAGQYGGPIAWGKANRIYRPPWSAPGTNR